MNRVIIIEDKLGRGVSLAEQFREFSEQHKDLRMNVSDICYFCKDREAGEQEIKARNIQGFNIRAIDLYNFSEIMDEYINDPNNRVFLIMDFLLDHDGSEGVPINRVNIRYARQDNRSNSNQLWFYTATGEDNERVLGELVGYNHILAVEDVASEYLRLELENDHFISALEKIKNNSGIQHEVRSAFARFEMGARNNCI